MPSIKKILVLSRENITNYGDPIIADCCKYLIEKTASENNIPVHVSISDVYEKDPQVLFEAVKAAEIIVFPGGGINSMKFNRLILDIVKKAQENRERPVFFNAIGLNNRNPNKKNEKLLVEIFNQLNVKQITTRGDIEELKRLAVNNKEFQSKWVFDPALWAGEAYGVTREVGSKLVGVGLIRPEIFMENGCDFSIENVFSMYLSIINELNARKLEWRLFTNGMKRDHRFGKELLKRLNLDVAIYLGENTNSKEQLIERIAQFGGIIATRLHANIIATALDIPSVGLVWNSKLSLFGKLIDCSDRYIEVEKLTDITYIVDKLEQARDEGYNHEHIESIKSITLETVRNIIS